jgi:hypothetical protein
MDSDAVIFPLVVLLFIAVPILVIWFARKSHQRSIANLAALAGRLGLTPKEVKKRFTLSERWLEGAPHGRSMRVWSYTTGSGKSQTHWVAVSVRPRRSGGLTFRLQPQGLGTKLAELFGAKEIQVGDRRFDEAWFVRTNEPALFGAALVPDIREKLMAAQAAGARGEILFEEGTVRYSEQGNFASAKSITNIEAVVPALFDLADVVEVLAPQK